MNKEIKHLLTEIQTVLDYYDEIEAFFHLQYYVNEKIISDWDEVDLESVWISYMIKEIGDIINIVNFQDENDKVAIENYVNLTNYLLSFIMSLKTKYSLKDSEFEEIVNGILNFYKENENKNYDVDSLSKKMLYLICKIENENLIIKDLIEVLHSLMRTYVKLGKALGLYSLEDILNLYASKIVFDTFRELKISQNNYEYCWDERKDFLYLIDILKTFDIKKNGVFKLYELIGKEYKLHEKR